jgi:hypothetical protein
MALEQLVFRQIPPTAPILRDQLDHLCDTFRAFADYAVEQVVVVAWRR